MEDAWKIEGKWRFPTTPESLELYGTLIITPEHEMVLDIKDFIEDSEEIRKYRKMLSTEVVNGFSHDGKFITLYQCLKKFDQVSSTGFITSSFYVGTALIGNYFDKKEKVSFKKISIAYNYLDRWLNISGIELEENTVPYESFKVRYEIPTPIEFYLKNGLKVRLEVQPKTTWKETSKREVCIKEEVFLVIEASEGLYLEEIKKYIFYFQNFFSFLISEPTYPAKIYGTAEKTSDPVEIVFNETVRRQEEGTFAVVPLYPYSHVNGKLKDILDGWLEKSEELETVYNLYFGTIYNSNIYLEHKFLNFIMALEAYHRRKGRNEEVPQEEHRKRIEEILEASSKEYRKWLEEKLKYSNEPSLRKRLKEIYKSLVNVKYITQLIPDKKKFIEEIVATRNYFVHYDETLKSKALKGRDLLQAVHKLKIIIEVCLLKGIGFSDEEIDEALLNNWKYKQMLIEQSRN